MMEHFRQTFPEEADEILVELLPPVMGLDNPVALFLQGKGHHHADTGGIVYG